MCSLIGIHYFQLTIIAISRYNYRHGNTVSPDVHVVITVSGCVTHSTQIDVMRLAPLARLPDAA